MRQTAYVPAQASADIADGGRNGIGTRPDKKAKRVLHRNRIRICAVDITRCKLRPPAAPPAPDGCATYQGAGAFAAIASISIR